MSRQKSAKLPLWVKFFYGGAEGSNSLFYTIYYVFGMFYLTDVVKVEPAYAGSILMAGTLWNAAADPLVGFISDRSTCTWGRRRPFIMGVAIPFGIIAWLLFTDLNLGPVFSKIYFLCTAVMFFTAYSLLEIPYTALAAEMTQDYDERTNLVGWRAGWSQVATITGSAFPLILATYFSKQLGSPRLGWSAMTACFGLICIPLILATWRATRGYELFPEKNKLRFRDMWEAFIKNRSFRYTVGLCSFGLIGTTLSMSVGMYFMTYYMRFNETQSSIAFGILSGCTILWIPIIDYISAKLEKRWAWIIINGVFGLAQCICGLLVKPESWKLFYFLMFFAASGFVGVYQLGWAMIPDVVEVDELKTDQRREGLYYGMSNFIQKICASLSLWIVGLVLAWAGYVPNTNLSTKAIFGIRAIYGYGVGFVLFISIIVCYFLPMTREKHTAVKEAIRLKREGKGYSVDSIRDIIMR